MTPLIKRYIPQNNSLVQLDEDVLLLRTYSDSSSLLPPNFNDLKPLRENFKFDVKKLGILNTSGKIDF
jgi:hypothetical protein